MLINFVLTSASKNRHILNPSVVLTINEAIIRPVQPIRMHTNKLSTLM
jgi:hypothetical protein